MALDATKLHKVAGGGKALFMYETADAIATVTGSGYFSAVTNRLKQYDNIIVTSGAGGTVNIDLIAVTSASDAATVTTTAVEGITAT